MNTQEFFKKIEKKEVGVIGDYCVNIITNINDFDVNRHVYIEQIDFSIGGASGLVAQQLSILGSEVEAIGVVGNDLHGKYVKDGLVDQGIGVSGITTIDGRTGTNIIVLGDNRRTVIADLGVHIKFPDLYAEGNLTECLMYYSPSYPSYIKVIECISRRSKSKIFTDLGFTDNLDVLSDLTTKVLPLVDFAVLSKGYVTEKTFNYVLERVNESSTQVIITDGENGAFLLSSQGLYHIPAFKTQAIDVNGAGDTFISGIIHSQGLNRNMFDSIIFANALCAEKISQKSYIPSVSQIEEKFSPDFIHLKRREIKKLFPNFQSLTL